MCELEYNDNKAPSVFKDLIQQRIEKMQNQFDGMNLDAKGSKPRLREDINRMESWRDEFCKIVKLYNIYTNATKNQIGVNIGHDDAEVVQGFESLVDLFSSQRISKSFMVTDFGAIERYLISSL